MAREDGDGPLGERWSTGEVLQFVGLGFVFGVMVISMAMYDPLSAVRLVLGMLAVSLGYESGIIPQFKWEVKRRV